MSGERRPCPGAEYGCDRMIPIQWPWCRVRGCRDRARVAEMELSDNPLAREIAADIREREAEAELRVLLAQQAAELRSPNKHSYPHYQTRGAASGSVKLDAQLFPPRWSSPVA